MEEGRFEPQVAIVIPCHEVDELTRECVRECKSLNYSNYNIIVLPDNYSGPSFDPTVKIIETGNVRPLQKRFIALDFSEARFIAFIDSDAFPESDWLVRAIQHFSDSEVAAVSGPSLTPLGDGEYAKISGMIMASIAGSGSERVRYTRSLSTKTVIEAPTCNLVFRREILESVRGRIPDIWPAEEIALCGVVVKELRRKILYDPDVVVFHHRRSRIKAHLSQIWNYAIQKGKFVKKNREYVRPLFFLPSILTIWLIFGLIFIILFPSFIWFYALPTFAYLLAVAFSASHITIKMNSTKYVFQVALGTIATHLAYGSGFIAGLISNKPLAS